MLQTIANKSQFYTTDKTWSPYDRHKTISTS